MPQKINMVITSTVQPRILPPNQQMNVASLAANPSLATPNAPSALNAPILARVHNVRPGCGSCGRH